ncbi:methionine synthase [Leekyejoonella antrihumi]|uniref:Methionine synthase n=1 Tax=Leekyejoonella antrihumi TaxID=1660198 RepID=A0A563E3W6_9MICO|nr:methionine synthase [Leekyejoonella antrihumi]
MRATGVGSWPGEDARAANHRVRDILAGDHLPYLPELPGRGPGSDLVGRTAARLSGLAVDLQPSGWRLTDAPGRDARRGRGYLSTDLDELAEAYDGYAGPLKVQLAGPMTLAAAIRLPRGERAVSDPGAVRDIVQSLAETAPAHVADCARMVPGAQIVLQLDEPGLTAVLAGALPTDSGFGRLRALESETVRELLTRVVEPVVAQGTPVVLHSCSADVPLALLRQVPHLAVGLDTALLQTAQWEQIAEQLDSADPVDDLHRPFWFGMVPTDSAARHPREHVTPFLEVGHRIGLEPSALLPAIVTPACGLSARTPDGATHVTRLTVDAAQMLGEAADGMSHL